MKLKKIVLALVLAVPTVVLTASGAAACEPGDPNCNVGCEAINKTPVVNKIATCNT